MNEQEKLSIKGEGIAVIAAVILFLLGFFINCLVGHRFTRHWDLEDAKCTKGQLFVLVKHEDDSTTWHKINNISCKSNGTTKRVAK